MKRWCAAVGLVAVGCSSGVASASTALILGGAGRYADLTDEELADALGGYFANYDSRVNVPFAGTDDFGESIDAAADSMYDAVYSTPGKKTIGGVSQTAPAIAEVLRRLENDPDAPPPSELDAAMYGSPSPFFFRLSGVEYQPLPETPYNLLVVKAEYDGIADFPDNPFNLLAVVNAYMGYNQLHYPAAFADISQVPPEYITQTTNSKGGTTTTILIPTEVLPLLKPFADKGMSDETVAFLDRILRPLIDSAYNRPEGNVAELQAPESEQRSLSVVEETESDDADENDEAAPVLAAVADSQDQATDTQSLTHDTEDAAESAGTDGETAEDKADEDKPSVGKHAKADDDSSDDVASDDGEGRHAKKTAGGDVQRGKHAKADKDDKNDKNDTDKSSAEKSGGDNAGASDAAA